MPRRDYYDDDDDDRPRTRSRRRFDDDDDDYYDDPRSRRKSSSGGSNQAPIIIGVIAGVFVLIALGGFGAYLALRSRPAQQPQPQFVVNNPPPMVNMNPMAPVGPMGPGGPAMAGGPGMPAAPEMPNFPNVPAPAAPGIGAGNQATISNLRLGRFGPGGSLEFDYKFPNGRPIGGTDIVAVVKEPGQADVSIARFNFIFDQQGTMTVESFGRMGRGFQRGTTVYLGRQTFGMRGTPTPISNTLTLQ
ncbi:MAG TPA: hypothetical protein VHR66_09070 [Gemmataceae bacterium]|nr:hypothetical protein [Gemmataceae bacterium]